MPQPTAIGMSMSSTTSGQCGWLRPERSGIGGDEIDRAADVS